MNNGRTVFFSSLKYLSNKHLFPPGLQQKTSGLGTGQIIALRFAGDDELEGLVDAVLAGKLTEGGEIKRAIKHWRADTFRVIDVNQPSSLQWVMDRSLNFSPDSSDFIYRLGRGLRNVAGERKNFLLFKSLIAVGFLLDIVLTVQTITTYKYVFGDLMMQEAERFDRRTRRTWLQCRRYFRSSWRTGISRSHGSAFSMPLVSRLPRPVLRRQPEYWRTNSRGRLRRNKFCQCVRARRKVRYWSRYGRSELFRLLRKVVRPTAPGSAAQAGRAVASQ